MSSTRGLLATILGRLLVAALAPLLIVAVVASVITKFAVEREMRADNDRAIAMVALRVEGHLRWQYQIVLLAEEQLRATRGKIEPNSTLDAVVERFPAFESLVLYDSNGTVKAVGLPLARRNERTEFIGLDLSRQPDVVVTNQESKQALWSDAFSSVLAGHLALSVGDKFDLGTLIATWDLELLLDKMREVDDVFPGNLVILDRRGTVLYHANPVVMLQRQTWMSAGQLEQVRSGLRFLPEFEHDGVRSPVSLRYLPETGWTVIGVHATGEHWGTIARVQWALFALVVFATIVALGLALNLGKRVTKPLERLVTAAQALSKKGPRIELEVQPNRELQDLASAFSQMDEAVRQREDLLNTLADALAQGTGIGALERVARAATYMYSSEVAVVASIVDKGKTVEPRVVIVDNESVVCRSEAVTSSPFEVFIRSPECSQVESLCLHFPNSNWVTQLGVNTFWGKSVVDGDEQAIGLLLVGYREQTRLPIHDRDLMGLLASRVSAELLRLIAEEARMAAEAKERDAQEALVQAQKLDAVGTLVGGVAHDFNNLLAAMLGFTELAIESYNDGIDPRKDLDEVHRTVERARDLVAQLLVFSRPNKEDLKRIDLCVLVRDAMRLLRSAIPSTVVFEQYYEIDSLFVVANGTQMQQVLMNLCTNAGLAMPNGGILRIELKKRWSTQGGRSEVEVVVKDTGVGMTEEVARKAFEPFFTTRPVGKGTGLGLSVVHGIVNAHQGRIVLESKVGEGTAISIFLPEATNTDAVTDVKIEEWIETGHGEHIVVIDDERVLVEWLNRTLERQGYRVTAFEDVSRALSFIEESASQIDLLITDYTMPKINGIELVRQVRQKSLAFPIVIASGNAVVVSEEEMEELKIDQILRKPYTSLSLNQTVRAVITSHGTN